MPNFNKFDRFRCGLPCTLFFNNSSILGYYSLICPVFTHIWAESRLFELKSGSQHPYLRNSIDLGVGNPASKYSVLALFQAYLTQIYEYLALFLE